MTDRIPAEVLRRAAEQRAQETVNDHSPPKKTARKPAASGARILTAGMSVAAGIGLFGAMATSAAASNQPSPPVVAPTAQRVIIIEQPASTPVLAPTALPDVPITNAPVASAPAATTTTTAAATSLPVVRVIEVQPAPDPTPEPITVSEGS
jgi:hypothetical protein